eukprot:CAMPEP_0182443564 /NCGR_PEP_ID=MMETSP1172-20130603/2266_1 /TAXON_ID=708627 /ORGANISM="Timspurckia oligopyrenoides, Strain CCMP3278" /LENGTH=531 /DNA_ID=CAMNT_0024638881 /DNA_START=348 /DNA_END=1943 /DNA_ORIENTATION=-
MKHAAIVIFDSFLPNPSERSQHATSSTVSPALVPFFTAFEQESRSELVSVDLKLQSVLNELLLIPENTPQYSNNAVDFIELSAGQLCVLLRSQKDVSPVGYVILWKKDSLDSALKYRKYSWTSKQKFRLALASSVLAESVILEREYAQVKHSQSQQTEIMFQLQNALSDMLFEVRSPLGALTTFGKLLEGRLPKGDLSRDLARDILVQSARLQDLLIPLDETRRFRIDNNSSSTFNQRPLLPPAPKSEPMDKSASNNSSSIVVSSVNPFPDVIETLIRCDILSLLDPILSNARMQAIERLILLQVQVDGCTLNPTDLCSSISSRIFCKVHPSGFRFVIKCLLDTAFQCGNPGGKIDFKVESCANDSSIETTVLELQEILEQGFEFYAYEDKLLDTKSKTMIESSTIEYTEELHTNSTTTINNEMVTISISEHRFGIQEREERQISAGSSADRFQSESLYESDSKNSFVGRLLETNQDVFASDYEGHSSVFNLIQRLVEGMNGTIEIKTQTSSDSYPNARESRIVLQFPHFH